MNSENSPHRPALLTLIACATGIALARLSGAHLPIELFLSLLLFLLSGIALIWFRKYPNILRLSLGLICVVAFGFSILTFQEYRFDHSQSRRISQIYEGDAIIYGKITSDPNASADVISFFIETDSLRVNSCTFAISEKIAASIGHRIPAPSETLPKYGARIKLFATLSPLKPPSNPYEVPFDMKLKEHNDAKARAYSKSIYDLYILDSPEPSFVEMVNIFFRNIDVQSKSLIVRSVQDSVAAGFVSAVVLGDKSSLPQETLDDFQKAGLTHLLVVSGFNVAIIALIVAYLLRLLGLAFRRVRIAVSMIVILFYCLVVGLEPSVIRALIATEFIFLALFLERKPDMGNVTAGAALLTLLLRPYDLFDIGFQLSYGAVFSIVFIYTRLEKVCVSSEWKDSKSTYAQFSQRSLQAGLLSLSIFLGLLPVFLFHFHRVSVVGLIVNIIGVPIAGLITVLGFLLLPISIISPWVGSLYGESLLWLTNLVTFIAHISSGFGWSVLQLPRPQTIVIVLYLLGLWYMVNSQTVKTIVSRSLMCGAVMLALLFIAIPFSSSVIHENGKVSILFFDVGQGDAILLTSAEGKNYMIDFGGINRNYSPIADRVIRPLFQAEGIRTIEAGFVTHMHIDHYGGLKSILESEHVHQLYTSGERTQGYAAFQLDSIIQSQHLSVERIHQGQEIRLAKDLSVFVLNPESTTDEVTMGLSSQGMNHNSLALKVVYGNSSALLLGDIEGSDEEALVHRYGDFLKSDIVKVAHHGSRTSSTPGFVKTCKPKYAVISVGKNNTFGHPAISTLKHWVHNGAQVMRTDKSGALLFESDGKTFSQVEWQ
ncbi:MAG: DNA internalization-related competence protein ComEC/Rec2 [bacterium]